MRLPSGSSSGVPKAIDEPLIAGEDRTQQLAAVEVLAGDDAQLTEHRRQRLLRFIDGEHRARQRDGNVLAPACTQGHEAAPAVVARHHGTKSPPSSR